MKRVAIIGIQGVPASYGGFESLVENIIGENQSEDVKYTIFCSSKDMDSKLKSHKGCELRYIPLHANGMQSIPYDMVAMARSLWGYDTLLVLGVSGCLAISLLKLLSRKRIIVNIDGLEHRRDKWGGLARWVLRTSEAQAVRWADVVIADNKGIQDYVRQTYNKDAELIAYGGDHAMREIPQEKQREILRSYGLTSGKYSITVCRIEPENNCHVTLEAFSNTNRKLVFIGNWQHSEYSRRLHKKYTGYNNMVLLDSVYDLDVLYTLRSNADIYIHGHSAGGTNPSLVEAMFFGCPIIAYDVVYNRATTDNKAYYFKTADELRELISNRDLDGSQMPVVANERYRWALIAKQYEALY